MLAELEARLPPAAAFSQQFSPAVRDALPFYWAGYRLEVRYTYRLEELGSPPPGRHEPPDGAPARVITTARDGGQRARIGLQTLGWSGKSVSPTAIGGSDGTGCSVADSRQARIPSPSIAGKRPR